mmetsp:Transcript_50799/g.143912  ORF Transcript_50799/g.143912 Transcript_50799/m.143912 type:complete len:259 (-) Transcript_50799:476-1252(-)
MTSGPSAPTPPAAASFSASVLKGCRESCASCCSCRMRCSRSSSCSCNATTVAAKASSASAPAPAAWRALAETGAPSSANRRLRCSRPASSSNSRILRFKLSTSLAVFSFSAFAFFSSCFTARSLLIFWFSVRSCAMTRSSPSMTYSKLRSLRLAPAPAAEAGAAPFPEAAGAAPAPPLPTAVEGVGEAPPASNESSNMRASKRGTRSVACSCSNRSSMTRCCSSNNLSARSASLRFLVSTSSSNFRICKFSRMNSSSR